MPEFFKKYLTSMQKLEECYFYVMNIGKYSIHIQEDKENEFHFFSIWKNGDTIKTGWSEEIENIYKEIDLFLKRNNEKV